MMLKKMIFVALTVMLATSVAWAEDPAWNTGGGEQDEALALTPNLEHGAAVYKICAACHMPEGWGSPDGTFPQVAGQPAPVVIKQLSDIRNLNRDNPTMYPFALEQTMGGSQSVADVAAYIESLPMNPDNGKGEWAAGTPEYAKGEQLYKDNCVQCHGDHGQGDAAKFYPLIMGQHYEYMVRQFEWIRDGKRRNANPDMVKQIAEFSDADMKAVINYVSRIAVPKDMVAPAGQ